MPPPGWAGQRQGPKPAGRAARAGLGRADHITADYPLSRELRALEQGSGPGRGGGTCLSLPRTFQSLLCVLESDFCRPVFLPIPLHVNLRTEPNRTESSPAGGPGKTLWEPAELRGSLVSSLCHAGGVGKLWSPGQVRGKTGVSMQIGQEANPHTPTPNALPLPSSAWEANFEKVSPSLLDPRANGRSPEWVLGFMLALGLSSLDHFAAAGIGSREP